MALSYDEDGETIRVPKEKDKIPVEKLPYPNCKEPERCKDLNACPREYSCSH
jgi:hypothetical protein